MTGRAYSLSNLNARLYNIDRMARFDGIQKNNNQKLSNLISGYFAIKTSPTKPPHYQKLFDKTLNSPKIPNVLDWYPPGGVWLWTPARQECAGRSLVIDGTLGRSIAGVLVFAPG